MSLTVVGINHKSAPVAEREKVSYSQSELLDALCRFYAYPLIDGIVIVSTCNRTEWIMEHQEMSQDMLFSVLSQDLGTDLAISDYGYLKQNDEAVAHLIGMAAGLDSMVLGEPQILGQVKASFRLAEEANSVSSFLYRVFQHVFKAAKRIRTETAIGENAVSVAYVAVQLAKQLFSELKGKRVLLIGAGDTVTRVAMHLSGEGVEHFYIANRTLLRGQDLAKMLEKEGKTVKTLTLEAMTEVLPHVDVVVSSTGSPVPVLGKGAIEKALQAGRIRPLFMLDLAVPRDIEPEASELEHVYLYSIDDLELVIADHIAERNGAKECAEVVVEEETTLFMRWLKAQDAVGLVQAYRSNMTELKEKVLNRALKRLQQGEDPGEVLLFLADRLTNVVMHAPSVVIKESAAEKNYDKLALLREILNLH